MGWHAVDAAEGAEMVNRLGDSGSTYLRQHADNPVDWWQWGDEAFAEAARRDVPVLVSIGYASCHWCHVMAHESFEDPAIAALINEHFVAIKVDREERPDVDAVYMTATQALTGQGGWPMTCFVTPDRVPFYAGTYFPPTPRSGLPSFRQLLTALSTSWREDREQVLAAAGSIAQALREHGDLPSGAALGAGELGVAVAAVLDRIDPAAGGFRGAPKFPPAMVCEFLLRHHERTGSAAALDAVSLTLEAMARGGIHDQLAGGFARYSVDARWHVPHFEKMLDDNALLLRVYAHHARLTGSVLSRRIAELTGDFLLRDLRTTGGAFAASLDADTAGVEGATYLWTAQQLMAVLGDTDGARAAQLLTVGAADQPADLAGSVLRLPADPDDPVWFDRIRRALLDAREARPQPIRDELIVLRSNGLAIAALAEAGAALGRPDWIAAAEAAADRLLEVHLIGGRWRRSSRAGVPGPGAAVLVDHADLAAGLLALYQATGRLRWRTVAEEVLALVQRHFRAGPGEYDDTADDADSLFLRPRDPADGAAPAGASSLADALLTAAALSGDASGRREAEDILARVAVLARTQPRSAGWYLAVAEAATAGPLQIAVVSTAVAGLSVEGKSAGSTWTGGAPTSSESAGGDGTSSEPSYGESTVDRSAAAEPVRPESTGPAAADESGHDLAATARRCAPGGSVIEIGRPDEAGRELLAGRPLAAGRPTAYVCRGFVCELPVTTAEALANQLRPA